MRDGSTAGGGVLESFSHTWWIIVEPRLNRIAADKHRRVGNRRRRHGGAGWSRGLVRDWGRRDCGTGGRRGLVRNWRRRGSTTWHARGTYENQVEVGNADTSELTIRAAEDDRVGTGLHFVERDRHRQCLRDEERSPAIGPGLRMRRVPVDGVGDRVAIVRPPGELEQGGRRILHAVHVWNLHSQLSASGDKVSEIAAGGSTMTGVQNVEAQIACENWTVEANISPYESMVRLVIEFVCVVVDVGDPDQSARERDVEIPERELMQIRRARICAPDFDVRLVDVHLEVVQVSGVSCLLYAADCRERLHVQLIVVGRPHSVDAGRLQRAVAVGRRQREPEAVARIVGKAGRLAVWCGYRLIGVHKGRPCSVWAFGVVVDIECRNPGATANVEWLARIRGKFRHVATVVDGLGHLAVTNRDVLLRTDCLSEPARGASRT